MRSTWATQFDLSTGPQLAPYLQLAPNLPDALLHPGQNRNGRACLFPRSLAPSSSENHIIANRLMPYPHEDISRIPLSRDGVRWQCTIESDNLGALWVFGSFGVFVLRGGKWTTVGLPPGFPARRQRSPTRIGNAHRVLIVLTLDLGVTP